MLLQGVTGSGKTELYLRLARAVLETRPERARARAGDCVSRRRWPGCFARASVRASRSSTAGCRTASGTISGIASGAATSTSSSARGRRSSRRWRSIGLVVVDEEHDTAYKQEETPRYHGRDVAIVRARMEHALVVLGTATPSLESAANAQSGRYGRVVLTRRVLDRPLATVQHRRHAEGVRGARAGGDRQPRAARGHRGSAREARAEPRPAEPPRVRDRDLLPAVRRVDGVPALQRDADVSSGGPPRALPLLQLRGGRAEAMRAVCGGEFLEQSGFGTERIEADLRERFPGARIARVDRDTVRRRGAIARVLADVAARRDRHRRRHADDRQGTRLSGGDARRRRLGGRRPWAAPISARPSGRFSCSPRSWAARAEATTPGRRHRPDAVSRALRVRAAAAQDYAAFYAREMEFRSAMHYPPVVALVNVVVKGRSLEAALADATDLVRRVRQHGPHGKVLGPAPARAGEDRRTSTARSSSSRARGGPPCAKPSSARSPSDRT